MTEFISVTEARKYFPKRNGKFPHVASVIRRIVNGCNGIRLRAVRDGGRWYTTPEWVEQFQREYTQASIQPTRLELNKERSLDNERAMERLVRRYGIENVSESGPVHSRGRKAGRKTRRLQGVLHEVLPDDAVR